ALHDALPVGRPAASRALPASTIEAPKGSPPARDSDRTACALSRDSCRALASTSRADGATVNPSMSSAVMPLSPVASLRYDRAVPAAFFFGAPLSLPVPCLPAARAPT